MYPYSLLNLNSPNSATSAINASSSTLAWLTQPMEINSSGTLGGTSVVNVGQGVQINGTLGDISVTNPATQLEQVIMGVLPDGNYGLQVSKNGVDVRTATKQQLTFDSESSFTVAISDTFTFPGAIIGGNTTSFATTQAIPHNAPYTPAVVCYAPSFINSTPAVAGYPTDWPTTTTLTFVSSSNTIIQGTSLSAFNQVFYGVDSTYLYLGLSYANGNSGSFTFAAVPVTYYVYTSPL